MADECCVGTRGNVNGVGVVDLSDLTGLVSYLTGAGYVLPCYDAANVGGTGIVDLNDLSALVSYLTGAGYVLPDCPPSPVTDIDGNVYTTVKIGTQIWMAENLKVTHYRNGDSIPNVRVGSEWLTQTSGAYCNYNNDSSLGAVYGHLYNWSAVSDGRGLAPTGWHVASDAEWQTLVDYLGGDVVAGDKLKEAGTSHWNSPNSGNNQSGFRGLPGGSRQANGDFMDLGIYGVFMSSTETAGDFFWMRALYNQTGYVQTGGAYKLYGYSVRCVKDQ